jgi:hypothetical protein
MTDIQTDSQLGDLRWDCRFNWWEGLLRLPDGESFRLYIESRSENDRSLTDEARFTASKIVKSDQEIRRFAAARLLGVHNESWNEGDSILEEDFIERMDPDGITIFKNGNAEIGYSDDGMFLGHYIEVRYRGGIFTEALVSG